MITQVKKETLKNKKIAIIAGRFNAFIVDSLIDGAKNTLIAHGIKEKYIDITYVPGAFEIPLVLKKIAAKHHYDALIALGAIMRGATPHFEYIASVCAHGISRVSLEFSLPIAFGVLTVENVEQALGRSGKKSNNKGKEAALCTIEMLDLFDKI